MKEAQIQLARQQLEQLDELRRQTGATRTESVRLTTVFFIREIREHGVQLALLPNNRHPFRIKSTDSHVKNEGLGQGKLVESEGLP